MPNSCARSDSTPLTPPMAKSDDPIFSSHQTGLENRSRPKSGQNILAFWNIFDESPRQPSWRPWLGFCLTFLHLFGVMTIIVVYFQYFRGEGRPTIVDSEFASAEEVSNGSMKDYICRCDLPPEIQDGPDEDTRNKTSINRCYELEEVRQQFDVLQFGQTTGVNYILQGMTENPIATRTFKNGYSLRWESYELLTSGVVDPFDSSDANNPSAMASLTDSLTKLGFIQGTSGSISVLDLRDQPFFTLPPGFIKAEVDYTCTDCTNCEDLWTKYSVSSATESVMWNQTQDVGWIYCYNVSAVAPFSQCQGSCRLFPTQFEPWGNAVYNFAVELDSYIQGSNETQIVFRPRILYANRSRVTPIDEYNSSFLEIDRTGASWALLLNEFISIPECAERTDEVVICNGTSICEAAQVYSPSNMNSEEVNVVCMNYPTKEDYAIDAKECGDMVQKLSMVPRVQNQNVNACEAFQCKMVQSVQVDWDEVLNLSGEGALSRQILSPGIETSYIPAICVNNYTRVYVQYKDSESDPESKKVILKIHEMHCITGKSQGCWLTGRYKNVTSTRDESWLRQDFSAEDILSGKSMFACYRFKKQSHMSYLYDKIGIVAGIIGSWLLLLSCVFWSATKVCNPMNAQRRDIETTSPPPRTDGLEMKPLA